MTKEAAPSTPPRNREKAKDPKSRQSTNSQNHKNETITATLKKDQPRSSRWRGLTWFAAGLKNGSDHGPEANLSILIEIVSAIDLIPPKTNATHANPYVTIKYANVGGKYERVLHKTSVVKKTLNPIWTVKSQSLFLLEENNKVFENFGGLRFEVLHGDISLGAVMVPADTVMNGEGERMEFPLSKGGKCNGGLLALRFREATEEDIDFIKDPPEIRRIDSPRSPKSEEAQRISLSFKGQDQHTPGMLFRRRSRRKMGSGERELRVRPHPEPGNEDNTTWMTKEEIDEASLMPSKKWLECGRGSIGKIYLEIIGCDGLPNLDVGGLDQGNVTDPFVGIVFEDSLVRTDVIHDTLSPRWMPWSQRAFTFSIMHPTSLLIIGVFDYDGPAYLDHDPIGRLVINHQNLHSKTVYLLKYALYSDTNQNEKCGTVTVRLRIDINDEKEAVQKSFAPPPQIHINVKSKKSLRVLRYLCKGQVNMEKTNLKTVGLHASEYFSYFYVYCYAIDVLLGVLLWRGSISFSIQKPDWVKSADELDDDDEQKLLNGSSGEDKDKKDSTKNDRIKFVIWFPIHSILLFYGGAAVIEDPSLIPAAFFFTIGWILFVIGYYKSYDPSPWQRCNSFYEITSILLVGRHVHRPVNINPYDGEDESAELRAFAQARTDRVVTFLTALKDVIMKYRREYGNTDATAFDIETEDTDWTQPFYSKLYYLHLFFSMNNKLLRMIGNVLGWRSSLSSYYLTVDCFAIGLFALFVPWDIVTLWVSRIFFWGLFGPWMKLVDLYFVREYYRTDEELMENPEPRKPDIDSFFKDEKYKRLKTLVRIAKEDSVKLKEMREFRFGEFNQIVPVADTSRYPSIPLPESTAAPFSRSKKKKSKFGYEYLPEDEVQRAHVPGQKLQGRMIHRLYDDCGSDEEESSDDEDEFQKLSL